MRKRAVVALVLSAAFVIAASVPANAGHSWGSYHWARKANPFTLKLGDNVTSQWDAYLSEASTDWSKSSVLDTTIVAGGVSNVKRCPITSGRVEVCNASYGYNGWLGVAGISVSGGHITGSYVKLNDTYFNSSTYNTPAYRRFVMCQEIGHAFGLDHTDETFNNANHGTCMDYTNDPDGGAGGASSTDPSNEHPYAHDYEQLETIYSHTDSSTTVGASAPSGPGKSSRSRLVNVDKHGNGTILFITWIR